MTLGLNDDAVIFVRLTLGFLSFLTLNISDLNISDLGSPFPFVENSIADCPSNKALR